MIGGSPCQDLSIAKKNREGLKGSRSNLFWEYVRILNEVKPKYFVLENVASMSKESKEIISESLGVQPVMINASLVSAQNRKRLFWIGKFNGKKYVQVEVSQPEDKNILLSEVIETVSNEVYTYRRTYFRKNLSGKVPTLTANMGTGGNNIPYVISSRQEHATVSENKSTPLTSAMGMGGGHVPCISLDGENWRKITPVECLRLQSMPDDYFDKAVYKNKPISNTQRYKMCGNAFNCKVIEHILKYIV
jgi:DNA-cytosine methyltransferase